MQVPDRVVDGPCGRSGLEGRARGNDQTSTRVARPELSPRRRVVGLRRNPRSRSAADVGIEDRGMGRARRDRRDRVPLAVDRRCPRRRHGGGGRRSVGRRLDRDQSRSRSKRRAARTEDGGHRMAPSRRAAAHSGPDSTKRPERVDLQGVADQWPNRHGLTRQGAQVTSVGEAASGTNCSADPDRQGVPPDHPSPRIAGFITMSTSARSGASSETAPQKSPRSRQRRRPPSRREPLFHAAAHRHRHAALERREAGP